MTGKKAKTLPKVGLESIPPDTRKHVMSFLDKNDQTSYNGWSQPKYARHNVNMSAVHWDRPYFGPIPQSWGLEQVKAAVRHDSHWGGIFDDGYGKGYQVSAKKAMKDIQLYDWLWHDTAETVRDVPLYTRPHFDA